MSILQYPDSTNVPQLHVWNNAAFENGESEDTCAANVSWANLEPGLVNQSLESDGSKENQSPIWLKSAKRDEKTIDMEIKEIEKEITRLWLKLESLRHEKAEYNTRSIVMRGRSVPVKCMGQKQITKNFETIKKFEDPLFSSAKKKLNQRAVGVGPMEIFSAIKSRHVKQDIATTPIQSIHSGRKSCFFKLQDIDEGKVKRKSGSLSPKSRRTISKVQAPKPAAATTVGSKWGVKKEDAILATVQPKKLFKDGEESARKPLKPGRVVVSRYNQIANQSNGSFSVNVSRYNQIANQSNGSFSVNVNNQIGNQSNGSFSVNVNNARKRNLTENDKEDECNRHDKKRASCEQIVDYSCKNQKTKSRAKKKWEIPNEVMVYNGEMEEESPKSVNKMKEHVLPKIRTVSVRLRGESPRDSGAAKRVVELIGRKSYFSMEEETGDSVCQALSFAQRDGDDEE